ncbi:sex comb reduced-B [Caerostris extrusa]|uniref:Sex comb reduced-B n=1 Tax=Caerostris extrusa TaxID=172846 RepID=A0AAV4XCL7_CAEEX|nr:sex comb reduced-B [Caerostris extrusa]
MVGNPFWLQILFSVPSKKPFFLEHLLSWVPVFRSRIDLQENELLERPALRGKSWNVINRSERELLHIENNVTGSSVCNNQARQDPTAQDYYTPPVQAYGSCFNGPSSPVQPQTYGAPYSQHLQTQNGDPHHFSSCSQQQRLSHSISSQSPRTPTPSVTPVPSCKYAEPPTVHAASPQDLSTTSSSSQPPESQSKGVSDSDFEILDQPPSESRLVSRRLESATVALAPAIFATVSQRQHLPREPAANLSLDEESPRWTKSKSHTL